jgi:hypothetical protein
MKNLSEKDKSIVNLLKEGKTYKEICFEVEVTDGSLRSRLRKMGINKKTFKLQKKECINCSIQIEYNVNSKSERNKKFCSNSCSASYNNKIRDKAKCGNCKNCDKKLNKAKKKYCDNICQGQYKRKETFTLIENGDNTLHFKNYKKFLIEKHGDKCMKCGWCEIHETTGNVPIQLDHIDGDSDNNNLKNLRLLCPNCHSLTPTFGRLNENSKRSKRKDYRKDNSEKNKKHQKSIVKITKKA